MGEALSLIPLPYDSLPSFASGLHQTGCKMVQHFRPCILTPQYPEPEMRLSLVVYLLRTRKLLRTGQIWAAYPPSNQSLTREPPSSARGGVNLLEAYGLVVKEEMAEHNLDSVRKEDGQKGGQHPLLKRRLAFGRCANNHPGRGRGRSKALRQKKMNRVGTNE